MKTQHKPTITVVRKQFTNDTFIVPECSEHEESERLRALFEAAPDMLSVVQDFAKIFRDGKEGAGGYCFISPTLVSDARAAIAKATKSE